ncbi:[FeFe] hydrogenase, group A [Clostridioides sp. ZZV14-6154]|uniref:[FeFe] hydrogenase, group A n=1 Tax=unclassified Clostridioides TaxID=2635829 RepID=UPI001D1002C5|nr:[FeFe] hydrogenase, group A [Clostridioides sp. ZZV14-6154]MCC0668605.1 [FeFe] hydrogenase, group A [Clostridioides sp. ZZV14-6153]
MKHSFTEIRIPIEKDNPAIFRDESKCVKCGQCRTVCEKEIAVGKMYDLDKTGDNAICIHCGQCAVVCPVESITQVYDYEKVKSSINDSEKIVIFSTSPSVRVALGEEFGMEPGTYVEEKMVSALRKLGADYVFDTTFSADLTIMEEASELIERITKNDKSLPQFTSCCPAWVKFVETFYPELIPNLSTAKSPIGMQGPTIKTYFAKKKGLNPKQIVNVAVTPCTAKKYEILRPEMNDSGKYYKDESIRDMDYVITTKELAKWLKEEEISFENLEHSSYDDLLGRGSGAGIIFGNTGGVMEAAIRTAYYLITGEQPPQNILNFTPIRGIDGIKEAEVKVADKVINVAVIHGTANAKSLIESMNDNKHKYDFIEVMTCRGGCISGAGQPKTSFEVTDMIRFKRIAGLYNKDNTIKIKSSYENLDIKQVYKEFYGSPLSDLAESMLHTAYNSKNYMLNNILENENI